MDDTTDTKPAADTASLHARLAELEAQLTAEAERNAHLEGRLAFATDRADTRSPETMAARGLAALEILALAEASRTLHGDVMPAAVRDTIAGHVTTLTEPST